MNADDWLQSHLDGGEPLEVEMGLPRLPVPIQKLNESAAYLKSLSFRRPVTDGPIKAKKIDSVFIDGQAEAHFENCYLGKVTVHPEALRLSLRNTWVGQLEFTHRLKTLAVEGGGIASILAPQDEPLSGNVEISTFIPRFGTAPVRDLQSFRNLRKNLNNLHNNRAAGFFHSVELSLTRKSDRPTNKVIGWVYEVLSDFGNSTARPLWWFAAAFLVMFSVAVLTDNLFYADDINTKSWHSIFLPQDVSGRIARGFFYTLFSILNPLGVFSSKPVLHALPTWWLLLYAFLSLLALISLALFLLSLRRRFKLE